MNKLRKETTKRKRTLLQTLSFEVSIIIVVDDWISMYKENKISGVLDLVQLLTDASGHNRILIIQMIEEQDPKEVIESLAMTIPGDKNAPIMNKQVRVRISVFFQTLIQKCNSLLFDNYLLDTFFSFLVPMSRNSLRSFRYAGTLVGLKITTALVNVLKVSAEHSSIAQQQLLAEQTKGSDTQSSNRIELLQDKISELQENEKELSQMLHDYLMRIIFKQRILDTMPEIQIFCLNEAVIWMQICPDMFMVDQYLGYYKLLMPIPTAGVREAILRSLLLLYEAKTLNRNLELFITKSISNIVQMTLDSSLTVSVVALNLITEIMKTYGSTILEMHTENLFYIVFSKHKQVATAAGTFLLAWLNAQTNRRPSHVSILMSLTEFFEEAHLPNHAPFMVEALLQKCPALVDWEAMCLILIRESGDMTAERETCFLKIMTAAMEQACCGTSPRTPKTKPSMTGKAVKLRDIHESKITEYFTEHLPQLLHKYRDDADKVVMLFQVAQHLKLERILPAKEEILNMLAQSLESLIEIHSNEKVLRGCCDVMEFINSELHNRADTEFSLWWSIESNLFGKFKQAEEVLQKCCQMNLLPNDDQIFTLSNSLEKIAIFYEYKDQKWKDIWSICLNHITHSLESLHLPVKFVTNCIKICHLNILWDRVRMEKDSEESTTEEEEVSLQSKILQFLYVLQQLLTHEVHEFCKTAFFVICDILLVFCENCMPIFPNLGVSADDTLQSLLQKYVEKTVFAGDYVRKVKKGVTLEFRQSVLIAYSKLVSCGMLKIKAGIWLFKYYEKKEKDYDDILQKTFGNMLQTDEIESAEALMSILIYSFKNLLADEKRNLESVKQILKDQFGSFPQLLATSPQAVMHFHEVGILFAFEKGTSCRGNKIFLEVLMNYIQSLTPQQSLILLQLVKSLEEDSHDESNSTAMYQTSLLHKSKAGAPQKRSESSSHLIMGRAKTSTPAKRQKITHLQKRLSKLSLQNSTTSNIKTRRKMSISSTPVFFQ